MPQSHKSQFLQTTLDPETASTFFTFLAYGILTSIQRGVVPAETGIWTVGRPKFWQALVHHPAISPTLIEILQQADEWEALRQLNPVAFEEMVARYLSVLESELEASGSPAWWNSMAHK